jgi:hypothetical protein
VHTLIAILLFAILCVLSPGFRTALGVVMLVITVWLLSLSL